MSAPRVERYQQKLAQDPASLVFIELVKLLIEQGDYARAKDVCENCTPRHPGSIEGRVLWGKALIHLKRPAEAMEQFDRAMAIDRENPLAFNLISEVLLQKGLFRSALPILRKALVLQPNDPLIREWFEKTQQALVGGPPPVFSEMPNWLAPVAEGAEPPPEESASAPAPASAPSGDALDALNAADRALDDLEASGGSSVAPVSSVSQAPAEGEAASGAPAGEADPPVPASESPVSDHPLAPVPPVLMAESPAAESQSEAEQAPGAGEASLPNGNEGDEDEDQTDPDVSLAAPPILSEEAKTDEGKREPKSGSGRRPLLHDIPDAVVPAKPALKIPKAELSPSAAKAIAEDYERELKDKLKASRSRKTFVQKHWGKVAALFVVAAAALVGAAAFWHTSSVNRGRTLEEALRDSRQSILKDTRSSYRAAIDHLNSALRMDDSSEEARALTAYAQALLFAEHNGGNDAKAAAQKALDALGQTDTFAGLALVARYLLSDGAARDQARSALLSAQLDKSEVHEAVGRILFAQRSPKRAVDRLKRALELNSNNVRALVALGDYYREYGDCPNALKLFDTAAVISPEHPSRIVGSAECRLELGQDRDAALKDLDTLPPDDELSGDLLARKELVHGRLLAAEGQFPAALKVLSEALPRFPGRAYDFQLALGEASRGSGALADAQKAFEEALKLRPKSEEAREGLGRVLIARDREQEVLARISNEPESRRVALVRGMAYAKMGDYKRARVELSKTQVSGKYPPEAVVQLALADAAEGQEERAQEVLEKAVAASKKSKSEVRVALGQVYWRRGATEKAMAQFQEAGKDPSNYEGPCARGRMLMSSGDLKGAIDELTVAVSRNPSHGEARHALGRAYLANGDRELAIRQFQAWESESPQSAGPHRDMALALYRSGRLQEADAEIAKALKVTPNDPEAHRIRAAVLFGRGDPKAGFGALEKANKLNPKDATTFCEIGLAFLRQGNEGHAAKAFEAAQREDSRSACARAGGALAALPSVSKGTVKELGELGESAVASWDRALAKAAQARALLAQGAAKEARKAAEQAVEMEPQLSNAHFALGLAAVRLRDDAKAREALFRAEALDPAHSGVHLALGELLSRSEADLERAYQEYQLFMRTATDKGELNRVKKLLPHLKKRLAAR